MVFIALSNRHWDLQQWCPFSTLEIARFEVPTRCICLWTNVWDFSAYSTANKWSPWCKWLWKFYITIYLTFDKFLPEWTLHKSSEVLTAGRPRLVDRTIAYDSAIGNVQIARKKRHLNRPYVILAYVYLNCKNEINCKSVSLS